MGGLQHLLNCGKGTPHVDIGLDSTWCFFSQINGKQLTSKVETGKLLSNILREKRIIFSQSDKGQSVKIAEGQGVVEEQQVGTSLTVVIGSIGRLYIYLHLPSKSAIHVRKYTSPMDPMG